MNFRLLILFAGISVFLISGTGEQPESGDGAITGIVELAAVQSSPAAAFGRYRRGASPQQDTQQSILIWLEKQSGSVAGSDEPVVLDQEGLEFVPEILAVRQHQAVRILNSDPVYHNVFSLSSVKRFDVGRRPQGEYLDVTFDRQGVVEVFCDIHSNMHAVIYVVPPETVDWLVSESGSRFEFSSLADGRYRLNVYVPGFNLHTTDLTVTASEVTDIGTISMSR